MPSTAAHALRLRLGAGLAVVTDGDLLSALVAAGYTPPELLGTAGAVRGAPQLLAEIHRGFVSAGVHLIRAATGRTTPAVLRQVGYEFRASAITSRAVDLALDAVQEAHATVAVAGVLGPLSLEHEATPIDAVLHEEHGGHAQRLLAAGCDAFYVGPMLSMREAVAATAAAARTGVPVLVALAVTSDPRTLPSGDDLANAARAARAAGADVVIAEGGSTLGEAERAATTIADALLPFGCAPMLPTRVRAEKLVALAERLAARRALVIGGGPGVSPADIAAVVRALDPQVADAGAA